MQKRRKEQFCCQIFLIRVANVPLYMSMSKTLVFCPHNICQQSQLYYKEA